MTPTTTLAIRPDDFDIDALLDELRLWVEMETPSSDAVAVNRLADRIETLASDAGFEVVRKLGTLGFGDILAIRSPVRDGEIRGRTLILAHIDTVHATGTLAEQLPLRQEGDKLYGPGIYDMKSGVLMAFEAMKRVVRDCRDIAVDLLIVSDEEVGSKSSRPVIEEFARTADNVLVVEPARDGGKIVTARKGVGMCDIVVRGRSAHAGVRPADGRSAVRAASRLVLALEALNDPHRGITVTVGTIHGGTGRNTVPEECRLQVDLRLPDSATADEILAKINAMTPEDLDISFEIEALLNRPPFAQSEQGRALFDEAARIAQALGIHLEGMETGGGSDGNFTAAIGVPTLDGLGADGAGAHTYNEHVLISSIVPRTALLANLILALQKRSCVRISEGA
ncbi:M20 family peptidase [Ochrobactrum intermedium]|uniref:M20 family metallopeptidase n=1 Tax=Brucella intermedia TaxID=94625 RepID=UPI00128B3574|nr:M20 family metallopeptidase [Brucella intermedia]MPR64277.1 M20 family peptidase [Brucella intermedia]